MWPRRKTQSIKKPNVDSKGYERWKAMRAAANGHPEAPTVDERVEALERKVRTLTNVHEARERHDDAPGTE